MKKVTAILIGAGDRGMHAYGSYALDYPNELEFIAVADPDVNKRDKFSKQHRIKKSMCFESWEEILKKPRFADIIFICTPDRMHYNPAIRAIKMDYHILLEKPMATNPFECIRLGEYAKDYNRAFIISHVLRYTPFFKSIKKLLNENRIGKLVSIQHNENVGFYHQAHSYVRGNWRNSKKSSPMVLAKSCHDMDIMLWLVESECEKISSFGSLMHFKKESAPAGVPKRCLEGCPIETECPFYAPRIYSLEGKAREFIRIISFNEERKSIIKALEEGPYGKCVYHCDNDVVDHQVVNIEFSNNATAVFTMCAFTNEISRTIKLMGTKGEIRGMFEKGEIEITDFASGRRDMLDVTDRTNGHRGGDFGIMHDTVRYLQKVNLSVFPSSASVSTASHLMAFAAEKSRLDGKVVIMDEFIKEVKSSRG